MRERRVTPPHPTARATLRDWLGLGILMLGTFVVQVDFFIVNVALPSIQRDLGATLSEIQLVAAGYGAAFAVTVITGGRLGDLFGRRRIFVIGVLSFVMASLLCGISSSGLVLVMGRVMQGIAAAMVVPQGIGSIHAMFSGQDRERAFGVYGVSMGLAWVSGLVLGGLLISADVVNLGWRLIFLINIPLSAVAVAGALRWVTESRRPDATRLDLAGMVTLAVVVALVLVPLIQGRQAGWPAWTFVCLGLAVVAGVALIAVERQVTSHGSTPVLPPDLLRDDNFRLGLLVIVVFFLGPPGFFLLTTLYLQTVLAYSPLQSGLSLLPFGLAFVLSAPLIKRVKARLGDGVIILGVGLMIIGIIVLAVTINEAATGLTVLQLSPGVALLGLGQTRVTIPLYEMLLRNVRKDIAATATGVFTTVQLVAQSLSLAVLVIIFAAIVGQRVAAVSPDQASRLQSSLIGRSASQAETKPAITAYLVCTSEAGASLVRGSAVSCDAPPGWRQAVDLAAKTTVSRAAREGFVLTLGANLLILVTTGLVVTVHTARGKRTEATDPAS